MRVTRACDGDDDAPVSARVTLVVLLVELGIEGRVRLVLLLAPRLDLGLELGGDDGLQLRKAQPEGLRGLGDFLEVHVLSFMGSSRLESQVE